MSRAIGIALLVIASVAVTIVVRAPAAWVGDWLEARSKLRLVDARGTLAFRARPSAQARKPLICSSIVLASGTVCAKP